VVIASGWESECPGSEPRRLQATFEPGLPKKYQVIPSQNSVKNFARCTLKDTKKSYLGHPDCQYISYSSVMMSKDHRSQMMAFCGHDLDCSLFNSEQVLQRAKENVERFYPVVGVLENLNKSLSVMEKLLPNIFKGATQVILL